MKICSTQKIYVSLGLCPRVTWILWVEQIFRSPSKLGNKCIMLPQVILHKIVMLSLSTDIIILCVELHFPLVERRNCSPSWLCSLRLAAELYGSQYPPLSFCVCLSVCFFVFLVVTLFMPPACKVRQGHLVIGSSVCPSVCLSVRLFVCNSVPLSNKVQYLKFGWWYSNQTWTVSPSMDCSHFSDIPFPWGWGGVKV